MNILGIAEQGLWAMERALKRVLGMCETVGCWNRSTCTVGNDSGWSQTYCYKCADRVIERVFGEAEEAAPRYPEEAFKQDCEGISKLVAEGTFFIEPKEKEDGS